MLRNRWMGLVMAWVLVLVSVGCATKTSGAAGSPEDVVTSFYDWLGSVEGSVLGSKAYRESPYLDRAMVDRVDELVASFEAQPGGGYDPFICAQDRPSEIVVTDAEVTGEQARVTVQGWNPIHVDLLLTNGTWLITDITCTFP